MNMTEAMREQFEAWMSEDGAYPQAVERNGFGEYRLMTTYTNWGTWQAALRSPAVAGLVEALREADALHKVGLLNSAPGQIERVIELRRAALAPFATLAGEKA